MLDDFAVFILTHGRADNVITYKTLQRAGYTGRVYIIIDNEDKQADRYYQNFGDKVIMFDKAAEAEKTDTGDNFPERNTVLFARNACFDIAEDLGIEYFLVLDDDYSSFDYRYGDGLNYVTGREIKEITPIIEIMLAYYKSIEANSIAMAQGGDFIGGHAGKYGNSLNRRRKVMNTFFLSTKRKFDYISRMNDDVSTYIHYGNIGNLFLTISNIAVIQKETQKNSGGLTDMYLAFGTYVKSFYTVMYLPSAVFIEMMGTSHKRLHHQIKYDNAVPCIISEDFRKVE